MKIEKIGKIQNILMFFVCVVLIVGLTLTNIKTAERKHDVDDIKISVTDISTSIEDGYYSTKYYVNMDFKIENKSKAKANLQRLDVTMYLTDKSGKSIGTITSSFGSSYSSSSELNLERGKNTILSSYLSATGNNCSSVFSELYNNGLKNCNVEYKITYARWTDDHVWSMDY